tara:strand:- start:629 stop:955 length:327 start_codon:yes stop_codon:yes gene_type:complete
MARYTRTPSSLGPQPTIEEKDNQPRYLTVKYPIIPRSQNDIYVFSRSSDRYDTLALAYYSDSSLWWIISTANPNFRSDSLIPPIGSQLRIPSILNVNQIISNYESLNR